MSDAFFSVVAGDDPTTLLVRARRPGDIKRVFPHAEEFSLPGRDYQFRAFLPRTDVINALSDYVGSMSYKNFKNSIRNDAYHNACSSVWNTMARLQPIPPYSTRQSRRGPLL